MVKFGKYFYNKRFFMTTNNSQKVTKRISITRRE